MSSRIRFTFCWGTGMIASSSTFSPIRGGSLGISVLSIACCMAWYRSTSLQQSSKGSCSRLVSGHNLQADCQWRTLAPPPWLLRSTMPYHPHPHIIICTSFHLFKWLQRFYRITMSLKSHFVPKSDVKQWFTTTTTTTTLHFVAS